ncbi:hypothetical protein BH11MYX4_BH11MYX4_21210 [soil metagenome]
MGPTRRILSTKHGEEKGSCFGRILLDQVGDERRRPIVVVTFLLAKAERVEKLGESAKTSQPDDGDDRGFTGTEALLHGEQPVKVREAGFVRRLVERCACLL